MNIEAIFGKVRLLRALTSLDRAEFVRLEEAMEKLLAEERTERRHDGLPRQRAFGAGGPGKLPTTRARLLFLLFYFKCYPLQEVLAFLFSMSQPQACEWIKKLTPLGQPGARTRVAPSRSSPRRPGHAAQGSARTAVAGS